MSFIDTLRANAPIITAMIAILATTVATFAIRHNISINRRNKRIDIIAGCNLRYDAIYDLKLKLLDQSKAESETTSYFGRFWGLKSDQFDYWLAGFVDIETFTDWSFMTIKAFRENRPIRSGQSSFDYGWVKIGADDHDVTNPWFTEFTWSLRELGIIWDNDLREARAGEHSKDGRRIKEAIRKSLFEIIEVVTVKSSAYRTYLQHEMTQAEYDKTAREFPLLAVTKENRHLALREIHNMYWRFRQLPIFGRALAMLYPSKVVYESVYQSTKTEPRPCVLDIEAVGAGPTLAPNGGEPASRQPSVA